MDGKDPYFKNQPEDPTRSQGLARRDFCTTPKENKEPPKARDDKPAAWQLDRFRL